MHHLEFKWHGVLGKLVFRELFEKYFSRELFSIVRDLFLWHLFRVLEMHTSPGEAGRNVWTQLIGFISFSSNLRVFTGKWVWSPWGKTAEDQPAALGCQPEPKNTLLTGQQRGNSHLLSPSQSHLHPYPGHSDRPGNQLTTLRDVNTPRQTSCFSEMSSVRKLGPYQESRGLYSAFHGMSTRRAHTLSASS